MLLVAIAVCLCLRCLFVVYCLLRCVLCSLCSFVVDTCAGVFRWLRVVWFSHNNVVFGMSSCLSVFYSCVCVLFVVLIRSLCR